MVVGARVLGFSRIFSKAQCFGVDGLFRSL